MGLKLIIMKQTFDNKTLQEDREMRQYLCIDQKSFV